jgi:hypothetical protein
MGNINLNPQILPSRKGGVSKEHNKVVTVAVWAAVIAVVIGGVYWWGNRDVVTSQLEVANQLPVQQEVAASLNRVIIHTSPAEARKIADELSRQEIGTPVNLQNK